MCFVMAAGSSCYYDYKTFFYPKQLDFYSLCGLPPAARKTGRHESPDSDKLMSHIGGVQLPFEYALLNHRNLMVA